MIQFALWILFYPLHELDHKHHLGLILLSQIAVESSFIRKSLSDLRLFLKSYKVIIFDDIKSIRLIIAGFVYIKIVKNLFGIDTDTR